MLSSPPLINFIRLFQSGHYSQLYISIIITIIHFSKTHLSTILHYIRLQKWFFQKALPYKNSECIYCFPLCRLHFPYHNSYLSSTSIPTLFFSMSYILYCSKVKVFSIKIYFQTQHIPKHPCAHYPVWCLPVQFFLRRIHNHTQFTQSMCLCTRNNLRTVKPSQFSFREDNFNGHFT
jgi:hypothetical protein